MRNPEQELLLELLAAASGRPLPSEAWREFDGRVVDALGSQGSQNWDLMAETIRYVETGANSPLLLAFFKKSESMFMGSEFLSPTYGLWGHLLPVALIHAHATMSGDTELAAAALGWQQFFWTLVRACTAPDDSVLSIGWRASPWQDPERDSTLLSWVRDVGLGRDVGRWEAAAHRLGLGLGQSPVRAITLAVQPSLAAGLAAAPTPSFRAMTTFHSLRNRPGAQVFLAVYLETNGNGNTPPRMAGLWQDGRASYLPAGDLVRVRQQLDRGVVTRQGSLLVHNSSIYGTASLALPSADFAEVVLP